MIPPDAAWPQNHKTVRSHRHFQLNIDHFNASPDDAMVEALTNVDLWGVVVERGVLDADLYPDALSQGQKQLLALAQAVLRENEILIWTMPQIV